MIFDKHTHRRKPLMAILQLIAEKEVRDYAQRQMERAEQWENILFTGEL